MVRVPEDMCFGEYQGWIAGIGKKFDRNKCIGKTSIKYKGKTYKRYKAGFSPDDKKYQREIGDKEAFYCECGAKFGQYHELGCDMERCPICKGQLLSCGHGKLFESDGARCR